MEFFKGKVSTISCPVDLIEDSRRAIIVLANGTRFYIPNALYLVRSRRNMLSHRDIRRIENHIKHHP